MESYHFMDSHDVTYSSIMGEKLKSGHSTSLFEDPKEFQTISDNLMEANSKLERDLSEMTAVHALKLQSLQEKIKYLKEANPTSTTPELDDFFLEKKELEKIEDEENRKTLHELRKELECIVKTDNEKIPKLKELLKGKNSELTESEEKRVVLQRELDTLRGKVMDMDTNMSCSVKPVGGARIEKLKEFLVQRKFEMTKADEKRRDLEEKLEQLRQEHNNLKTEISEMTTFHALELESSEEHIAYLRERNPGTKLQERKDLATIEDEKRKVLKLELNELRRIVITDPENIKKLETLLKIKDSELTDSEEKRFGLQWELDNLRRGAMEMNQKMPYMVKTLDSVHYGRTAKLETILEKKEQQEIIEGEEKLRQEMSDRDMNYRDISLTHTWINCQPDKEDGELRKKNAERVAQWRMAYFTCRTNNLRIHEYETDPSIHAYMKYRYSGSLVDFVCPTKRTRDGQSSGDFEAISSSVTEMTKVANVVNEVTEVRDVTQTNKGEAKRKRRFLGCFGHYR